jgi:hypothetical protein
LAKKNPLAKKGGPAGQKIKGASSWKKRKHGERKRKKEKRKREKEKRKGFPEGKGKGMSGKKNVFTGLKGLFGKEGRGPSPWLKKIVGHRFRGLFDAGGNRRDTLLNPKKEATDP